MQRFGRIAWGALIAALFTLGTVMVTAKESPYGRATRWAAEHARQGAPWTLEELGGLPPVYRLAVIRRMDPTELSRLWREQLGRFVRDRRYLTAIQERAIADTAELLTPEYFQAALARYELELRLLEQAGGSLRGDELVNHLRAQGASTESLCVRFFTAAEPLSAADRRLFQAVNLGLVATPRASLAARYLLLREWFYGAVTAHAKRTDECACRNEGWCECGGCLFPIDQCCGNHNCDTHLPGEGEIAACGCFSPALCWGLCTNN
jgi:hypothetical protein